MYFLPCGCTFVWFLFGFLVEVLGGGGGGGGFVFFFCSCVLVFFCFFVDEGEVVGMIS